MTFEVNYSFGEQLLHRLVLGSPWIGEVSFDLEKLALKTKIDVPVRNPVFISGLARSGTTILMRIFYETGKFRSLTYRDMPFVLMPGIWKMLSQNFFQHADKKERAHGDGIFVNFDSPEAFEEVFWRTFCANEYIFDDCLIPHSVSDEMINEFKIFVRYVVSSANQPNQQRYLSKNNNNILRLGAIRKAYPNALIIIPFRDPIQHALSLFQQHQNFCTQQKIDTFSYDYMRWIGHYEFGLNHLPFKFSEKFSVLSTDYRTDDINYWLTIWIDTYRYILESAPHDIHYVSFERLYKSPDEVLSALFKDASLSFDLTQINETIKPPLIRNVDKVNSEIIIQAQKIYQELLAKSLAQL